ncbi:chromate resistance protein ChrB domain-containing protein [Vreelandella stevensii]|uniref:chromate resistance protein ChrB domain-containing protein n=1 Tax=Halomonadaceae TaxID=28256 RepID=UPI00030E2D0D|nr:MULTISPECIES: chromate resistance protein ChrB domain-containing protein [Halomonas]KHJ50885.1 ChrB [Halomonas hydrothermalis]
MADHAQHWLILIMRLAGRAGTPRMRIWRALRGLGAAVLRDGVYLLPASHSRRKALEEQMVAVRELKGNALLIEVAESAIDSADVLASLFDRTSDFQALQADVLVWQQACSQLEAREAQRQLTQLQRRLHSIVEIDFFPGPEGEQTVQELANAETLFNRCFVPDEPRSIQADIPRLERAKFCAKVWATRRRPWVDRLASAWLIRRFIDPEAHFVWLAHPSQCPVGALGFDFDGADFTHVGEKVTFEVLIASFGLEQDMGLQRMAALVHYLDVGGTPVAEAVGLKLMLAGARERCDNDDVLLQHTDSLFDDLYQGYLAGSTG